ncbi:MAG: universal stress protein [Bacillota bacterium]
MSYRRILVPVDGSATGARGLAEALKLAKGARSRLRLVHVVDEAGVFAGETMPVDVTPILQSLVKSGRATLAAAERRVKKAGVAVETALYESVLGSAADTILRDARKWRADLIVMGTHGRRGLRRLVLGSDAEQVVRGTPVPVMLVRAKGRR